MTSQTRIQSFLTDKVDKNDVKANSVKDGDYYVDPTLPTVVQKALNTTFNNTNNNCTISKQEKMEQLMNKLAGIDTNQNQSVLKQNKRQNKKSGNSKRGQRRSSKHNMNESNSFSKNGTLNAYTYFVNKQKNANNTNGDNNATDTRNTKESKSNDENSDKSGKSENISKDESQINGKLGSKQQYFHGPTHGDHSDAKAHWKGYFDYRNKKMKDQFKQSDSFVYSNLTSSGLHFSKKQKLTMNNGNNMNQEKTKTKTKMTHGINMGTNGKDSNHNSNSSNVNNGEPLRKRARISSVNISRGGNNSNFGRIDLNGNENDNENVNTIEKKMAQDGRNENRNNDNFNSENCDKEHETFKDKDKDKEKRKRGNGKIFDGCVIYFNGRNTKENNGLSSYHLNKVIVLNGGTLSVIPNSSVTHVICTNLSRSKTNRAIDKIGKKKNKRCKHCYYVTSQWISDSIKNETRMKEEQYSVIVNQQFQNIKNFF